MSLNGRGRVAGADGRCTNCKRKTCRSYKSSECHEARDRHESPSKAKAAAIAKAEAAVVEAAMHETRCEGGDGFVLGMARKDRLEACADLATLRKGEGR